MSENAPAPPHVRLLALSGSLRRASSNGALLQAAARLAPAGVAVEVAPSVGDLPHFDPDRDGEGDEPPAPVAAFRARLRAADGVLISCPEYIHGVPGAFKNALDWVASTGDLVGKPVALLNASATAHHAQAALVETLTVLMASVATARVPLRSNKVDADAVLADPATAEALRRVVADLAEAASASASPRTLTIAEPPMDPTPAAPDLGTKHQFHGVQPTLPVVDVAASVAYYRDVLGFEADFLYGDPPTFGRVKKGDRTFGDPVFLRFVRVPADRVTHAGEVAIHVGHDVDGLCDAYRALGVTILHPPRSEPWGLREFRVADPDGHTLRFGGYLGGDDA